MTGRSDSEQSAGRSATIRSRVENAEILAASVRPDNTTEIDTRVERDDGVASVVTTAERETTGGLRSTIDDYVVNLAVAQEVVQIANRFTADADNTTQS
ncbi:KEOPS complex subunit Pcc1 [Halorussus pelagicus]|uniref:KEOPS complex subunit Pcc1 n=1 Tax=Halorussus pelagicus TaxID=2505977 RepID=UPI000FFC2A45|nr:KEOPS complex subunit Pcc1 [Halorussus pelagicus]